MSRKTRKSDLSSISNCKTCGRLACLSFMDNYFCLTHFHTHVSQKQTKESRPLVISNAVLERQSEQYKLIAKTAMTDVIMQMMELQRQEQEQIRLDPLSALELHAPRLSTSQLALNKRSVSTDNKVSASIDRPSKARRVSASTSSLPSQQRPQDDLDHACKPGSKPDFTGSKCTKCGSENTTESFSGSATAVEGSAGTRGETWGSKDRPVELEGTRCCESKCHDCGHVKITKLEF
jgi:hypothetical protein